MLTNLITLIMLTNLITLMKSKRLVSFLCIDFQNILSGVGIFFVNSLKKFRIEKLLVSQSISNLKALILMSFMGLDFDEHPSFLDFLVCCIALAMTHHIH